jgi:hypothetical protein
MGIAALLSVAAAFGPNSPPQQLLLGTYLLGDGDIFVTLDERYVRTTLARMWW